jgi:hypothetical protein
MITAIVVPVDPAQSLHRRQISPSDVDAYHAVVGGPLQLVAFDRPPAALYINEEGKLDGLNINARATVLTWVHNSNLRGHDVIVGDALLVGPPDQSGRDRSVPDEYLRLLLSPGTFTVEVQVHGDERWYGNEQVFGDVFGAYAAGIDLAQHWTHVVHVRVNRSSAG